MMALVRSLMITNVSGFIGFKMSKISFLEITKKNRALDSFKKKNDTNKIIPTGGILFREFEIFRFSHT